MPIVGGSRLKDVIAPSEFEGLQCVVLKDHLPIPGLMTYQEWEIWRAGPECRPRRPAGSAALEEIFDSREGELHR